MKPELLSWRLALGTLCLAVTIAGCGGPEPTPKSSQREASKAAMETLQWQTPEQVPTPPALEAAIRRQLAEGRRVPGDVPAVNPLFPLSSLGTISKKSPSTSTDDRNDRNDRDDRDYDDGDYYDDYGGGDYGGGGYGPYGGGYYGGYTNNPLGRVIAQGGQILNLGKNAWDFISRNKGKVSLDSDFADAVPNGVKDPFELTHFSDVQVKSFHHVAKNLVGLSVVEVDYSIVYRYGGSYQGKGHYLSSVGVLPSKIWTSWGNAIDGTFSVRSIANVGSAEDPVAAMVADIALKRAGWTQTISNNTLFFLRGDKAELTWK